jgi:hypothetical protein
MMKNTVYITWALIAGIGAFLYYMLVGQETESSSTTVIITQPETSTGSEATTWLGSVVDTFQGDTTDTALGGLVDVFQSFFR